MEKENFNLTTKTLMKLTKQLQKCQKEKEEILVWIDALKQNNELLLHENEVKAKMEKNLAHFEKTVEAIKRLKEEQ